MKFLKKIILRLHVLINEFVLAPIDIYFSPNETEKITYPPIFIIGAPRSGSTLLSQVLIDSYNIGYMTNMHSAFFGMPVLAEGLLKVLPKPSKTKYSSKYGYVRGFNSPSEAGNYWYRFFRRRPAYVKLTDTTENKMLNFRRSISSLIKYNEKPLLFKNMYAALRLDPIMTYVPDALFVIIKRDMLDNAHSLLEVRKKISNNYVQWWSMEPPNFNELKKLPPEQQVVEQIRCIYSLIESNFKANNLDEKRVFRVNYEVLCSDTHLIVDEFQRFLKTNNVQINKKAEVPKNFERTTEVKIKMDLYNKLKDYIDVSS